MFTKKLLFSPQEEALIITSIKEAEKNTSGEIRVHIEKKCKGNEFERGLVVFEKLKMHDTKDRNAVLFYLAAESKKLAIIADEGINQKVPANFWDNIRDGLVAHFKTENYTLGLAEAITKCGLQLKTYFPYQSDDTNELLDTISYKV